MKKLLFILLAGICLMSILSAQAETCGENVYWTLENGVLRVSGSGEMLDYRELTSQFDLITNPSLFAPWIKQQDQIREVRVEEGVTYIGDYAFANCRYLERVTLADSVTVIGQRSFKSCEALREISFGSGLRSIGDFAFTHCNSLKTLDLPDHATEMGDGVFCQCDSLEQVRLPADMKIVGREMFMFDKLLSQVIFPRDLTGIAASAFYGCKGLTEVVLPQTVTHIGGSAFYNCTRLRHITLPDRLELLGESAFGECEALESLRVPGGITVLPKELLKNCVALKEATLPAGLVTIDEYAFYGCSALTRVVIPAGVREIGDGICNFCNSLTDLVLPSSVETIADDILFCFGGSKATIFCVRDSYAHQYAVEKGIPFSFDMPEETVIPAPTSAPLLGTENETVYNNGGEVIGYKDAVYYWRYTDDSFEDTGLMTGFSPKADAVNSLIVREPDGNERVLLTDTSQGGLYIFHDYLLYTQGSGERKAVALDGSGSHPLGRIGILGVDDWSGDLVYRITENDRWGETYRLDRNFKSVKLLDKKIGSPMTCLGVGQGRLFYALQDGRLVDVHALDLGSQNNTVLTTLALPDGYFVANAWLDESVLYIGVIESLGGTGMFYNGCGLYSVDLSTGAAATLLDPEASLMASDLYVVARAEDGRQLIYFLRQQEGQDVTKHDAAYQPYYSKNVSCLDVSTGTISDTDDYLTPEGEFIYRDGALACRMDASPRFTQVVSAQTLADNGYAALQEFDRETILSVKRFSIVHDRAYFEIQECVPDAEASLGWREGYRRTRTVLWEAIIGQDTMTALNAYGPLAAQTLASSGTADPSQENLSEDSAQEAEDAEFAELEAAVIAALETVESIQPTTSPAPSIEEPYVIDPETSTFYPAYLRQAGFLLSAPDGDNTLSLDPGTPVLVYQARDGWAHVNVQGMDGYLLLSGLTLEEPLKEAEPQMPVAATQPPVPEETPAAATKPPVPEKMPVPTSVPLSEIAPTFEPYTARTTKKGVNVRKRPDQGSDRVTQLSRGDKVTVLGEEKNKNGETWYQIRTVKGKDGYIRSDLLERADN